jgi:hypothetical protein
MLKFALLATGAALAASAATATDPIVDPAVSTAASAVMPCHAGQAPEFACALRLANVDGDASAAPAEVAGLAPPASGTFDGSPRPSEDDLAFKDAAIDVGSVLPGGLARDHDRSRGVAPALLALGALILLLRRRPV